MWSIYHLMESTLEAFREAAAQGFCMRSMTEWTLIRKVSKSLFETPTHQIRYLKAALLDYRATGVLQNDDVILHRCRIYEIFLSSIEKSHLDCSAFNDSLVLDILDTGFQFIKDSLAGDDLQRCFYEADHIHNLPSLLPVGIKVAHIYPDKEYYLEKERWLYLERLEKGYGKEIAAQAKVAFGVFWKQLEDRAQ